MPAKKTPTSDPYKAKPKDNACGYKKPKGKK